METAHKSNTIEFKGKKYELLQKSVQKAFFEVGIISFRYYPQDKVMVCSDFFVDIFHTEQAFDNMPYSLGEVLICEEDRPKLYEMARRVDEGEQKVVETLRTIKGKNSRVTIVAIEWDKDGRPSVMAGLVEDIESEIRSKALLEALAKDFGSVYYVDYEKNQVIPHRLSEDIKNEYGEAMKLHPKYETICHAYVENSVYEPDKALMEETMSIENLRKQFALSDVYINDYRVLRNGHIIYCRMKAVNLSRGNDVTSFVMGFADINREKNLELEKMAFTDPVTGGGNYNYFKKQVRANGIPGYLISMDIEQFKLVNSTCGVSFGDTVLKKIWDTLKKYSFETDILGHINADHFVIFSSDSDKDDVMEKIQFFSEELYKISVEMRCPRLHPYFGITKWDPRKRIEEAYSETSVAKHAVKEKKEVNYIFYSKDESNKIIEEKAMEDSFPEALANENFEVWYQPKIDPFNNQVIGAEALVRWRLNNGELVPPGKFIPLFERDGLIRTLDEYVFASVCKFIRNRIKKGLRVLPVSVNLSRASLYYEGVVEEYRNIVDDMGISPDLVPIEITESAAVKVNELSDILEKFRKYGFTLCVDDFGTGYSTLSILSHRQFDNLKVDKSLIDEITGESGFKLIKHTLALAKDLGMNITAEGVEDLQQVELLKTLRCDSIQGFVFSKPLPQSDFVSMLDK